MWSALFWPILVIFFTNWTRIRILGADTDPGGDDIQVNSI